MCIGSSYSYKWPFITLLVPDLDAVYGRQFTGWPFTDTRQLPPYSYVVKALDDHRNVIRCDGSYLLVSWNFAFVLNTKRLLPRKGTRAYSLFVACAKSPWFWRALILVFPFLGKLFLSVHLIWSELRSTEELPYIKSSW